MYRVACLEWSGKRTIGRLVMRARGSKSLSESLTAKEAKEWIALLGKTPRLLRYGAGDPGITVWAKWQSSIVFGDETERS